MDHRKLITLFTALVLTLGTSAQVSLYKPATIGQTSRNQKIVKGLEIGDTLAANGAVFFNGISPATGYVLTSDANGKATWQPIFAPTTVTGTWAYVDTLVNNNELLPNQHYYLTDKATLLTAVDTNTFAMQGQYLANYSGTIYWEDIHYQFDDSLITYRADAFGNEVYCTPTFNNLTGLTVHGMFCWGENLQLKNPIKDVIYDCTGSTGSTDNHISGFQPGLGYFYVDARNAIYLLDNTINGISGTELRVSNNVFQDNHLHQALSCTLSTNQGVSGNWVTNGSSIDGFNSSIIRNNRVWSNSTIDGANNAMLEGNLVIGASSLVGSDNARFNGGYLTNGTQVTLLDSAVGSNFWGSASTVNINTTRANPSSTDIFTIFGNIIVEDSSTQNRVFIHGAAGGSPTTVATYGNGNIAGSFINGQNVVVNGGTFTNMAIFKLPYDTLYLHPDSITANTTIVGNFQMIDGTQSAGKIMQSDAYGNASWVNIYGYGEMGFGDSAAVVAVTQNVWEVVTNGNEDLWAVGAIDLVGVTYTNDSLVISRAGTYTIHAQASVTMSSNSRIKLGVYKNGALLCTCVLPVHVDNGRYSIASYLDVAELAFGDVLQVVVMNETDSNPITFKGAKIIIDYKGT